MAEGRAGADLLIGLAAENGEWHRDRLRAAFRSQGIEPVLFSLADVAIVTGKAEPLQIPGFGDRLPDGVLLRTIAGGTFEATTLRLGVLHALAAAGVTVWNDAASIERCVDKSMTSLLLGRAGLPTPRTFVVSDRSVAAGIVLRHAGDGDPLVLKPLFGSQGKGLRLVVRPDDLPEPADVAGVYYLQRFVRRREGVWRDYRVFVCDGEVVAGMAREGDNWITNVHQGGRPSAWAVPEEAATLAIAAARAVGVAYTGVDLIEDETGRLLLLELNSMPSWSGLQSITETDIAGTIVGRFLLAVEGARRGRLVGAT
jgi:ribosomal protein S6--L-glutamate ligase